MDDDGIEGAARAAARDFVYYSAGTREKAADAGDSWALAWLSIRYGEQYHRYRDEFMRAVLAALGEEAQP